MQPLRLAFVLTCLVALLPGCTPQGSSSNDADLATALPGDVNMSTQLFRQEGMTVGRKLKELRAHVKQGTLYDGSGKEIKFLQGFIGPPPGKEQEEQEREMRRKYTVIDVRKAGA